MKKISKREKILLIILGVLLVLTVLYEFIFTPLIHKINDLQSQADNYETSVNNEVRDKVLVNSLQENVKILNSKIISNCKDFFPYIKQYEIIVIINDMVEKSRIQCSNISFSEPSMETLNKKNVANNEDTNYLQDLIDQYKNINKETTAKAKDTATENTSGETSPKVEKISVNLSISGDFGSINKFIDEIKGYSRRIIIKDISLSNGDGVLNGSMNLEIYAIPMIIDQDDDYLEWTPNGDYGKDNPFGGNVLGGVGTIQDSNGDESEKKYDFAMSVRPVSSDLPTIMLGKSNDRKKETYVYADNKEVDKVEIHLKEESGKYYYKYKTSRDTYPKDYNTYASFEPKGEEVSMVIYSYNRNSEKDVSGANIDVYNDTNLKFTIDIKGDDKKRPRVQVVKRTGEIVVNRY